MYFRDIACELFSSAKYKTPSAINGFNGRRIYGGCAPPSFTIFFYFWLRSLRYEKDFLQVLSKLSQASMVKIFHFSDEWKMVSMAPQIRGGATPINPEVIFQTYWPWQVGLTLCMNFKLCMNNYLELLKKIRRPCAWKEICR